MVLGDAAASDLLQETNLHLWTQASQYDFNRPFLPWAFGFARQRVMAFRKSCSRSRLVFDDATLSLIDDRVTSSVSEIDDRLSALQKCLKKLSAQQAELIRERYLAKTSVTTMAERLNQTAHNISSQLHRIRKILAKVHRIHVVGGGALMDSLERRFTQLTSRALDGLCTDDERAELGRLASQHPELAAGVVDEAILHALLKWHSGNITEGFVPPEFPVDVTQDADCGAETLSTGSFRTALFCGPPYCWSLVGSQFGKGITRGRQPMQSSPTLWTGAAYVGPTIRRR